MIFVNFSRKTIFARFHNVDDPASKGVDHNGPLGWLAWPLPGRGRVSFAFDHVLYDESNWIKVQFAVGCRMLYRVKIVVFGTFFFVG